MKPYARVTLVYALFGVLWIFLSDRLVAMLADNLDGFTLLQTTKGWIFVGLSSLLLFVLTRQAFETQRRAEREKLEVFEKTVEGSCHILLNYLNQMQFVMMEAEQCAGFNGEIIKLANTASDEATAELKKLTDIRTITADHIDSVVYEKLRRLNTDTK